MSPDTTAARLRRPAPLRLRSIKTMLKKSRGAGGADENIKNDSDANDPGKKMPARLERRVEKNPEVRALVPS